MSILSQLAYAPNSISIRDMLVMWFKNEKAKDINLVVHLETLAQKVKGRVKERGELILELKTLTWSLKAFESVKLLTQFQRADMVKQRALMKSKRQVKFVSRVLPNKVGVKVSNLDLLGIIEDEQLFNELSDEDVVRVCLLISLEVIFMGRLLVDVIEDSHMRLVENIEEWNVFPWREYIWRHLYDQIMNVVSKHKWEHLKGISRSRNYISTYTLSGFLWAFKVWILESCEQSRLWWNKEQNDIPWALGWSRKELHDKFYGISTGERQKLKRAALMHRE
ncbi:hypothetical protein Tco_1532018 [Tanacetum coccineum]